MMNEQTILDDLPNELLAQIFKMIPFVECEKVMSVCSRWSFIIDELVGVRMYIGRPSEFWSLPINDWHPFQRIAEIGASTISFSDIEDPNNSSLTMTDCCGADEAPPSFKQPFLVRRLSFDGFLRQSTLIHLVEPIKNLAYLELHLSSLEEIDLSSVKLHFPKLQELIVSSNNYTLQHMMSRNLGQVIRNCTDLLELPYFPRLVTLRLYIPIVVQRSAQLLRALFKFLVRHNATMSMLLIRTEVTVSLVSEGGMMSSEDDPLFPLENSLDRIPELSLLKTQRLPLPKFRATFWAGDPQFLEFFRRLLYQQKEMTWCGFVTHEDFRPFPQQLIQHNYKTLQKLHLSVGVLDGAGNAVELSCSSLQDCTSLEHLGFIGNRTKENSRTVLKPDLTHTELLPPSLKFIEIYNILIAQTDVRSMALELPKLKTLHLENIGEAGELGMSALTLVQVVSLSRIIKIGIVAGINSKSLKVYSKEDSTALRMARILLGKGAESPSFVATLHEDGRTEWGYTEEDEKFT